MTPEEHYDEGLEHLIAAEQSDDLAAVQLRVALAQGHFAGAAAKAALIHAAREQMLSARAAETTEDR